MDDVQESSPLVKLQDAARATAEMWPRLNGASPRRERAGDGAGAEAGAGNGAGAGDRDGVWSLIAQVREWSRGCSIPPPGTGLGKGNGRGWSRGLPTPCPGIVTGLEPGTGVAAAASPRGSGAGTANRGGAGASPAESRDPPRRGPTTRARGQPGLPLPRGHRTGGSWRRVEWGVSAAVGSGRGRRTLAPRRGMGAAVGPGPGGAGETAAAAGPSGAGLSRRRGRAPLYSAAAACGL